MISGFHCSYDEIVGKRVFGTVVYKCTYSTKRVAAKVFPDGLDDINKVSRELESLDCENHANVANVYKVNVMGDKKMYILLDMYDMNLDQFLKTKLEMNTIKNVCQQILDGVLFLHNSNIVHGNLCPSNVLIRNAENSVVAVLSDCRLFELMPMRWKELSRSSSNTVKTEWMAPEILLQLQMFEKNWTKQNDNISVETTFSSDVFSVGCLLYYISTNRSHLFGPRLFREANILQNNRVTVVQHHFPLSIDMVFQMTTADPSKRLSITCSNSYFSMQAAKMDVSLQTKFNNMASTQSSTTETTFETDESTLDKILIARKYKFSPSQVKSFLTQSSSRTPVASTSVSTIKPFTIPNEEVENPQLKLELESPPGTQKDVLSKHKVNTSILNINQKDSAGCTCLHKALCDGENLSSIKSLIDQGADYKLKNNKGEGVLHLAVEGSNQEVIVFLISLKMNINEVDALGETPLHKVRFTKTKNYFEITKFLLSIGAEFHATDKNGNNVAHLFAQDDNITLDEFQIWVDAMIKDGHSHIFAIRGFCGRTPLQQAVQIRDLDLTTIKLLLNVSKVGIDQQDENGSTLLHLALDGGRNMQTIETLIQLGSSIKIKDNHGNGSLHRAVCGGNVKIIKYLISLGFYVNERNNDNCTPLHFVRATRLKNYFALTKLLLDNNAELYSTNNFGNTLAHEMARDKDVTCNDFKNWVTAMNDDGHGTFLATLGQLGRTILHNAMISRDLDLETIKLIIYVSQLDINQSDDKGDTILHLALGFGRSFDTIKNLLALGADWSINGIKGCSVMHSAVEGSNQEAFLYFKSLGADVNVTDEDGLTPLHFVIVTKNKDYLGMTNFLLQNGANLNAKDNFGRKLYQIMTPEEGISALDYRAWKEGMTKLGHEIFFKQKSSLGHSSQQKELQENTSQQKEYQENTEQSQQKKIQKKSSQVKLRQMKLRRTKSNQVPELFTRRRI